jgi:hypothetical protein
VPSIGKALRPVRRQRVIGTRIGTQAPARAHEPGRPGASRSAAHGEMGIVRSDAAMLAVGKPSPRPTRSWGSTRARLGLADVTAAPLACRKGFTRCPRAISACS